MYIRKRYNTNGNIINEDDFKIAIEQNSDFKEFLDCVYSKPQK